MQERRCHLKQPPFSNMFSQVFTFPAPHTGDRHKRLALLSSSGVAEPCFLASYPMNMQAVLSLITCLRLIFPLFPESSSAQMVLNVRALLAAVSCSTLRACHCSKHCSKVHFFLSRCFCGTDVFYVNCALSALFVSCRSCLRMLLLLLQSVGLS